jgi:hypothetical protein
MRPWSPDEPARQQLYQRLYRRTKERLDRMDDTIGHLLERIERLERRLDEIKNPAEPPGLSPTGSVET